MTAPLTPPDCDLRDFAFMPLDIVRLFNSRFHAIATDAEWRAGVTLWLKSFHQVPAGSLPDDEVELCRLAELGRATKAWRKLREVALHGWVKCSDGRWYHPVVCEKANEAWQRKLAQRERSRKGNEKRWGTGGIPSAPDTPTGPRQPNGAAHPSGNADGIPTPPPDDPQTVLEGLPKDSPRDSTRSPLTIPRDRDRDRDREEKNLNLSSEGRAGAREAVAPERGKPKTLLDEFNTRPGDPARGPAVLPSSISAELASLTARLEGRARGQPFLTPPPPRRTIAEQREAVAAKPRIRANHAAPEILAKARAELAEKAGAAR